MSKKHIISLAGIEPGEGWTWDQDGPYLFLRHPLSDDRELRLKGDWNPETREWWNVRLVIDQDVRNAEGERTRYACACNPPLGDVLPAGSLQAWVREGPAYLVDAYQQELEDVKTLPALDAAAPAEPSLLTDAEALEQIHGLLDGKEWSPSTLDWIAQVVLQTGREIRDPNAIDPEDEE